MAIPIFRGSQNTLQVGLIAAVILGSLVLSFVPGSALAAGTAPVVVSGASSVDPAAKAIYFKAKTADMRVSYRGRLNTTYWGTGRTVSVIARHMAPNSLRLDYVEPDSVRGRAVVVKAGDEWTYRPSRNSLTHRTFAPHSQDISARFDLLSRNYILKILPQPDIYIQRKTSVLEVLRRTNHTVARKFWIDSVTGLVLKREVLGEDGKLTVTIAFSDINFHPQLNAANFDLTSVVKLKGAKSIEDARPAKSVSALLFRVKPLFKPIYPAQAAGYHMVGSSVKEINKQQTAEIQYSDGLELLSLFEQKRVRTNRPTTVPKGMTPVVINGKAAHYTRRSSLETIIWDAGPLRLTLVGEANHNKLIVFAGAIDQFVAKTNPK